MKPTPHPSNTHTLGAGPSAIPLTKTEAEGKPALISFWKPTQEEIMTIAQGGTIALLVQAEAMPVVSITAVKV
jgi:hypothetical protein